MKLKSLEGDFAFKGLFKSKNSTDGWKPTIEVYFSKDEIIKDFGDTFDVKWPIEVYEDGSVYIPCDSELKEGV